VPLAELCRVLLRRHFRRMLAAERKARQGDDAEAVHELRVATRRLRATLGVAAAVAPAKRLRGFQKAIRQVAQSAGAVRDCDVFLAHVLKDQAALPEAERATLEPLVAALRADRDTALAALDEATRQAGHARFKRAFAEAIGGPDGMWDERPAVRDLAGSAIYRQYEVLRAHGPSGLSDELLANDEHLHEARIEAKRLRYLLETFEDVFGARLSEAVGPLVAVQDALGGLNDISVAQAYIAGLRLDDGAQAGLAAYLARRAETRPSLLAEAAKRWEKISSATYRRVLTGLIVKL
jgi:CHAD domain-containing protein